ncbi:flavin reductase [Pseudomonas sp. BN607]|uniref:flavin reductase n=1 Tax=Pseudomonas sp. BN607 TaxID=2567895 RepID=UPI002455AA3C|nr:flavin reductase [Pseudomonas sp. BN607]MDH4549901.1 flavin reductase [Pseudomonas sp. BN607]
MAEAQELHQFRPDDAKWFRQVLGQYPTGVCVVTAQQAGGKPTGMAVGSFTSVSLNPPLVAFLPDKSSSSWPRIEESGKFCVNILAAEQEPVCRRFAAKTEDKFEGLEYRLSANGSPIIEQCVAWIDCDIDCVHEAGDHYIVIGRVKELKIESAGLPLLFFQGGYGRFSPLSMVAPDPLGTIAGPLRSIDRARADMERLCERINARCVATVRVDDELIIAASAGRPRTGVIPTLVGQRLPFMPPTGSIFAAWSSEPVVTQWLRDTGHPERLDECRAALAIIRERGYSLGMISDAQRAFTSALNQRAQDPANNQDVRTLVHDLTYDPLEFTPDVHKDVRQISVPVFASSGQVEYVLTLYDFPAPESGVGVTPYIDELQHIADCLSEGAQLTR